MNQDDANECLEEKPIYSEGIYIPIEELNLD